MRTVSDHQRDLLLSVIDECAAAGRRRSEIAAFLAREYDLDAATIARLMATHAAKRVRRSFAAAMASAYITFVGLANKHDQVDVPFVTFI